MRIEAIPPNGLTIRRAPEADPHSGQRHWASRAFQCTKCGGAELGYLVTDHAASAVLPGTRHPVLGPRPPS